MKKIIVLLASVAISILLLEGFLYFVDPWGAVEHYKSLNRVYALLQGNPYTVKPGSHVITSRWSIDIDENGRRVVRNTNPAATRSLAFLGDSVVFGFGSDVNFVDLIAQKCPQVRMINAGQVGYGIIDIYRARHMVDADRYVYLITDNDAEDSWGNGWGVADLSAIRIYVEVWKSLTASPAAAASSASNGYNYEAYVRIFIDLARRMDALIIGFEGDALPQALVRNGVNVVVIPKYKKGISRSDPHPNAESHQYLADQILPLLTECH